MGIHVLVFCDAQKQHLYCKNMMQRYQRYILLGNFVIKILSSYLSPNGRRKRQWKLSLPRIYSKTLDTETELNNTSVKNELTSYCVKPQCTLPKLRHAQKGCCSEVGEGGFSVYTIIICVHNTQGKLPYPLPFLLY